MKQILYFTIFLSFANLIFVNAQSEEDHLFKTINNLKNEHSKKQFRLDSTLIESTKHIAEMNFNAKKVDLDSLRSLLRKNGNFDYNIEYVEISYSKIKKHDNILKESENVKLKQILHDSLYNNIGITIDKGLLKNKMKILATQNYVKFDDEFSIVFHNSASGYKQYNIVSGTAYINTLFYKTYKYDNAHKKLLNSNEPIKLNENNRFEIKEDITNFNGKPLDIEVVDSTGKIISYIKNR